MKIKSHALIALSAFSAVAEIHDLDSELHEVTDWIPLGLQLGIKLPELKIIEANYPNNLKRHRIEMYEEWQKKVTPTWSAVVQALDEIGMRRLAFELAQKHGWLKGIPYTCLLLVEQLFSKIARSIFVISFNSGTPLPKLPDNVPLDQFQTIYQQKEEVR